MREWLRRAGDRLAPLVFLFACVLAFGLQIPWLGYYVDDWIILHAANLGGAERLFHYAFLGNRPLVFWLWWVGFKLLGSTPLYWHLWALVWRWLTVVVIWLGWRRLWPNQTRPVALAALLFAVYPIFRQQTTALTYSFHWICFFLYGLSIYAMIRAAQEPKRYLPWSALAVLAGAIQLFSQEFYIGLELLRPFVLWLAVRAPSASPGTRWNRPLLRRVMFLWGPYLLLFAGYLVWRVGFMPTPGSDRNTPDLIIALVTRPLEGLLTLGTMFAQDTVEMLAGIWYKTARPDLWTIQPFSNLMAWAVAVVCFGVLALVLRWGWLGSEPDSDHASGDWNRTAIAVGFIAMVLGFAPGWAIGRHLYDLSGIYNDRFGLAAMPGAALLLVGLCRTLLKRPVYQVGMVVLLVALASGHHFRTTTDYRWSWERQRALYWQLSWRAPALEQPTAVLADGALVPYIGSWATISALNQMYAPAQDTALAPYWYVEVQKLAIAPLVEEGAPIQDIKNFLVYRAPSENSLVIAFNPEEQQCLWVLRPQDSSNRYISDNTRDALPLSNLERILPAAETGLRRDIFGPEPAHNWCYYFETADLARQFGDWAQVTERWHAAEAAGKRPRVGVEYLPFIEGFAHTGGWEQAVELTRRADYPHFEMQLALCETWAGIDQTAPASAGKAETVGWARDHLGCP